MKKTNLSGNVSLKDIDTVVDGLKELRQKMPFLVALTPVERRHATHVGLSNLGAAEDCLMAAREHPSILPGHFDLRQFEQDVKATVGLYRCLNALKELSSDVQDTLLAVGSDAIKGTRQIRAQVKLAALNTPGLKQLAQRFSVGSARAVGAETSELAATTDASEAEKPAPAAGAEVTSKAETTGPALTVQPAPASAPNIKAA